MLSVFLLMVNHHYCDHNLVDELHIFIRVSFCQLQQICKMFLLKKHHFTMIGDLTNGPIKLKFNGQSDHNYCDHNLVDELYFFIRVSLFCQPQQICKMFLLKKHHSSSL
jgi:hypothetical protein